MTDHKAASSYIIKSLVFITFIWAAGGLVHRVGNLGFIVLVLLLSVPMFMVLALRASLKRALFLSAFEQAGIVARYLGGTVVRLGVAAMLALTSSLAILVATRDPTEYLWIISAFVAIVVGAAFLISASLMRREVEAWYRFAAWSGTAIKSSTVLVVILLLFPLMFKPPERFETLSEAISAQPVYAGSSAILTNFFEIVAMVEGLKAYALGGLNAGSRAAALFGVLLLQGVAIHGLVLAFAAFVPSLNDYRRILLPATRETSPGPVPKLRIAVFSGATTLLLLFVAFPGTGYIEQQLRGAQSSEIASDSPVVVPEIVQLRRSLERIDTLWVEVGTIDEIVQLRERMLAEVDARRNQLIPTAEAGFAQMRANVPAYLDAYYSLAAEFLRVGSLVIGDFEAHVADELQRYLQAGDPFQQFEAELAAFDGFADQQVLDYGEAVGKILQERTVFVSGDTDIAASSVSSLNDLFSAFTYDDRLGLTQRAGVATGAGVATFAAFAGKKVVAQLAAKGTIKIAGSALAKLAAGKLAGGAGGAFGGALAGGAIGSVVPLVGTALGAAIGGVVGALATGVTVEYLILKLEEQISRSAFQDQILSAINEAEADFLAGLSVEIGGK